MGGFLARVGVPLGMPDGAGDVGVDLLGDPGDAAVVDDPVEADVADGADEEPARQKQGEPAGDLFSE